MKRLLVMRHAKSDWSEPGTADHDRPLSERGREAARTMGIVLARSGEVPDVAISSSALRARTTLELAVAAGAWGIEPVVTDDLYGVSVPGVLALAARAPESAGRLMLVGHEPTWSALVHAVTGASVAFKTATVVGIDLSVEAWSQVETAQGSVAYVLVPRLFSEEGWSL